MDMKNKSWFMFSVFFICFSLKSHVYIGADTISANQSLSGDQTIVSAGGVFALGFFKPGNSSNYYIGIWYKKMSRQNVVWVANRDKPISDRYSSVLRSQLYWNSGIWNGQIFSLVPEMVYLINNPVYNFGYVSNENERYFIYSVNDPKLITQFIIDSSGQIQQMYWSEASKSWFIFWSQPRRPCEVYAYCGPFGSCSEQTQPFCGCLQGFKPTSDYNWNLLQDYSGGCARKTQLQCGNNSLSNGKRDRFLANRNMLFPKNLQSVPAGSIKECETTCLNNCSCSAYSYENGACSIWIEKLLGLQKLPQGNNTNGKTIYIKLAASEVPSAKNNKGTVIGGAAGRRNSEQSEDGTVEFFPTWAASKITEGGDVLSLVDPRLEGNVDAEELSRICKMACWCVQADETHRPSMGQVVQILEGVLDMDHPPIPRSLQIYAKNQEFVVFFNESSSSQSSQTRCNNSSQVKSNTSSTIS
ncbi:hypothetical protein LWI29_006106 [Acer saccharum]|uniref:Uncharacterized protein n=1 Tax=Acer saccharum TaxID=4024 RepID=A0AA39SGZ5_ACESA|nr:hypothetical protein LWI29_006106 [Acer saccharum]